MINNPPAIPEIKTGKLIVSRILTFLLTLVFILCVIRLLNYALRFGLNTLQVDFSAYYTAGESLNAGLSK